MVQYIFTSTEIRRIVRDRQPRTATSTLPQLLNCADWEIEGCALSQRHYTTGTANSLLAETECPREQATIKQTNETSGLFRAVTGCSVSYIYTVIPSIILFRLLYIHQLVGRHNVCVCVCVCVCVWCVCVCVCVCVLLV